jgi:hypothetical protein
MNRYTKMYGWLYNTFGTTQFTIDDFRMIFPSAQPTKAIHDLIKLDFMKRVHRGRYQIIKPEEFVRQIIRDNLQKEGVLKHSEKPYAFCESTAVTIWTEGYYWTDFTRGFKPIHIQIYQKDLNYWIDFFKNHDTEYTVEGEQKMLFGVTYIIHPRDAIAFEKKDGDPVAPLKETMQFCYKNKLVYGPALEFLEKRYNLRSGDTKVAS